MQIFIGTLVILLAIFAVLQITKAIETILKYKAEKRRLQQNRSVWKPQNKSK